MAKWEKNTQLPLFGALSFVVTERDIMEGKQKAGATIEEKKLEGGFLYQ